MFNFVTYIKKRFAVGPSKREEKRKEVVKFIEEKGITWQDFEDVVFWKEPLLSLFIYLVFAGFCW